MEIDVWDDDSNNWLGIGSSDDMADTVLEGFSSVSADKSSQSSTARTYTVRWICIYMFLFVCKLFPIGLEGDRVGWGFYLLQLNF